MKRAPKRLSTAMRIALEDIRKVEKDSRYQVNMHFWHRPVIQETGDPVCQVCFAGSVMAKTLNFDPRYSRYGGDEGDTSLAWDSVFTALDYARLGEVTAALREMHRDRFKLRSDQELIPVARYEGNPLQWRKDMFKIVHMLERMGE